MKVIVRPSQVAINNINSMREITRAKNVRIPSLCNVCGCTLNKERTGNIIKFVHPVSACNGKEIA